VTTERFKTKPKTKFWKVTADSDVVDVAPNSLRKVTDYLRFFSLKQIFQFAEKNPDVPVPAGEIREAKSMCSPSSGSTGEFRVGSAASVEDALAKHGTDRCSLCPARTPRFSGLEDGRGRRERRSPPWLPV
jgi:hypothetical protein